MDKSSYIFLRNKERKLFFMAMVVVASSLTFVTLTMTPTQVNAQTAIPQINCATLDAINGGSLPECSQRVDRSEGSFDDCIGSSTSGNCRTSQNVEASNNIRQADINQLINTWIDCDRTDAFCLARTLNTGTQFIDLQTYRVGTTGPTSQISADVDQRLTQLIETDGQDRFRSSNAMTQNFLADAIPHSTTTTTGPVATIDAFGDVPVSMIATQNNDECDDVGQGGGTLGVNGCVNKGVQTYDLEANGRSLVDVASSQTQGLELRQYNNCDDNDSGTLTIDCFNDSSQVVKLTAGNPGTNNFATIDFDTLGNMIVDQSNDCDFGQFDCRNKATTLVDAFARGSSDMTLDNIEQDVSQTNHCDDLNNALESPYTAGTGCENLGSVIFEADSREGGSITVTNGEQDLTQLNDCDTAQCGNQATLYVGLGSDIESGGITDANDNPVEGTLTADYSQIVDQQNLCEGNSGCANGAFVSFTAYADGAGTTVDAESDQILTQINECGEIINQICSNTAIMSNLVTGSGGSNIISDVNQDLYQFCGPNSGAICSNTNEMFIDASLSSGGTLQYTTTQDINPNDGDGTAGINYNQPGTYSYLQTRNEVRNNPGQQ